MPSYITCPNCGHKIRIPRGKAIYGRGTVGGFDRMNPNKYTIMDLLMEADEPLTTNEVLFLLTERGIPRWQKGDVGRGRPTGTWNYHTVQTELSLLVGMDLATMVGKGVWDDELQNYTSFSVGSTPRYYLDSVNKQRYALTLLDPKVRGRWRIRDPWERGKK